MVRTGEVVVMAVVVVVVVVVVEVLPLDWGSFAEPQSMTLPGISSTLLLQLQLHLYTSYIFLFLFFFLHLSLSLSWLNWTKATLKRRRNRLVPLKPLHSLPRKYHHHELSRRSLRLDCSKSYHQDYAW